MSYCLRMSTGDMRQVIRLLTSVERTDDQERVLESIRQHCRERDARHAHEGVRLRLTVEQALEELLDGTPGSEMGAEYTYAFDALVSRHFSDPVDLGAWRRPSWFYAMDAELAGCGVPPPLRPGDFLFAGPPIRLPHPGDAFPSIGTLATALAGPLADAYEAVLHRLAPEFQHTAQHFAKLMRFEAEEWAHAKARGRTEDTIYFFFT